MTNVYRWSIAIFPTCEEVEDPLEDHSQMLLLPNEEFEQIAIDSAKENNGIKLFNMAGIIEKLKENCIKK